MVTRWSSFFVWALVAGSAVFWGLRLFVQPLAAPQGALVAAAAEPLRGDLSRLLGADAPAAVEVPVAVADPRFQLLGVLSAPSSRAEREGVALIAVDDRPPRAFRVGMVVDGDTVLQAVHARGASLGPRGGLALVALELPPPAQAATGILPGLAGARPPGMAAIPATQVFMPPGQAAPAFTRNRSPSPAMVPPPAYVDMPSPPPAMLEPQYNRPADAGDAGDAADADMNDQGANPIR